MRVDTDTLNLIGDVSVAGIDFKDYPDFCDAFIESAKWKDTGDELTEEEVNELNAEYTDFVYECVIAHIY